MRSTNLFHFSLFVFLAIYFKGKDDVDKTITGLQYNYKTKLEGEIGILQSYNEACKLHYNIC